MSGGRALQHLPPSPQVEDREAAPSAETKATGHVPAAEQILRVAAQTYLGETHSPTELALTGLGLFGGLKVLNAVVEGAKLTNGAAKLIGVDPQLAVRVAKLAEEWPNLAGNLRDLETAYHTATAELSKLKMTDAQRGTFKECLKRAVDTALDHSVMPKELRDSFFRATTDFLTLPTRLRISEDVAMQLQHLMRDIFKKSNWKGLSAP